MSLTAVVLSGCPTGSTINVWTRAIEVTQGTQPWFPNNLDTRLSGSVPPTFVYPAAPDATPLVAGRRTIVRVFAGVTGVDKLENVRAELRCTSGPTYAGSCPPPFFVNPTNGQITLVANSSLTSMRGDPTKSWNFVLPRSWMTVGPIRLDVEVLPTASTEECVGCDDAANRIAVEGVNFAHVDHLGDLVHFVEVQRQVGTTTFVPTAAEMAAHVDYLSARFPIDKLYVQTVPDATYVWVDDPTMQLAQRCSKLHSDLTKAFPNTANKLAVYALVDSGFGCAGLGGGGIAYGRANRPDSFAEEVGHAIGLSHAGPPPGHGSVCPPPGGGNCAECNPAQWCDSDWPWPHGTIGAYGFDPFTMTVQVPGTTEADPHDFMSYGGATQWVSPRSWIRVYNAFVGDNLVYPLANNAADPTRRRRGRRVVPLDQRNGSGRRTMGSRGGL